MKPIFTFSDGSSLIFDQGSFDEHCLYVLFPDNSRRPPKDTEYFSTALEISNTFGKNSFYEDFIFVYLNSYKVPKEKDFQAIKKLSVKYKGKELVAQKTLAILYCTMIAENNKKNTKLGKRIKRLGIHKLLFENSSVTEAANFMRGMTWKDIDKMCKERGF